VLQVVFKVGGNCASDCDVIVCRNLFAGKINGITATAATALVVGELLVVLCSSYEAFRPKPFEEKVVIGLEQVQGSELINTWVPQVFFDEEVPYDDPAIKAVAVLNSHGEQLVDNFENVCSGILWCLLLLGCGLLRCLHLGAFFLVLPVVVRGERFIDTEVAS